MNGYFNFKFKALTGSFTPYEKTYFLAEMESAAGFTCVLETPQGHLWGVEITAAAGFEADASVGIIEYLTAAIDGVATVQSLIEDGVLGIDINVGLPHRVELAAAAFLNNRLDTTSLITIDETFTPVIRAYTGQNTAADVTIDENLAVRADVSAIYEIDDLRITAEHSLAAQFTHVAALNYTADGPSHFNVQAAVAVNMPFPFSMVISRTESTFTATALMYRYQKLSDFTGKQLSELAGLKLSKLRLTQI